MRQATATSQCAAPAPAPAAEGVAGRPGALDAVTLASIAGLKARDPNFDPVRFLEGARQAHEALQGRLMDLSRANLSGADLNDPSVGSDGIPRVPAWMNSARQMGEQ